MSHYVNEYAVLTAIKTALDADSTLDGLLAAKSGKSKVILGVERPRECNLPTVHLSFIVRNINPNTKVNDLLIRVTWFVEMRGDGREDIKKLADIGERIYDLLDDNLVSVSGYGVMLFCAESGESSARDIQEPEGRPNHFQSLTFRIGIKRTN